MGAKFRPEIVNELRDAIQGDAIAPREAMAAHIAQAFGSDLDAGEIEVFDLPEIADELWLALNQDVRRVMMMGLIYVLANVADVRNPRAAG